MKKLFVLPLLLLTSCSITAVPVTVKFPEAPATLQEKCADLKQATEGMSLTEFTKVVKDTQVVREKGKTITQYVDREVVKYDNKCELPNEVIRAHNAAATMDASKLDGDKK